MKKVCVALVVGMFALVLSTPVFAGSYKYDDLEFRVSLAGDIDGFNLGLYPGDSFNWRDIPWRGAGEGIFDAWVGGPSMPEISWTQDGFEDFDVLASVGAIGHGGWGSIGGSPQLSVNGQSVGELSGSGENKYALDFFNLTSIADVLEQPTLEFSFDTPRGAGWWDVGAIDFSLVVALGRNNPDNNPAPVPEPATMLLFGTGLAGLTALSQRKNKKKKKK